MFEKNLKQHKFFSATNETAESKLRDGLEEVAEVLGLQQKHQSNVSIVHSEEKQSFNRMSLISSLPGNFATAGSKQ